MAELLGYGPLVKADCPRVAVFSHASAVRDSASSRVRRRRVTTIARNLPQSIWSDGHWRPASPVFLLSVFGKGEKANLSKAERNELRGVLGEMVVEYQRGARRHVEGG